MNIDIGNIVFWFVAFLFSLSIHEAAHAWTSEKFGDDTGRWLGRVSLNPAVHIDLFGTIIFPLLGLLTTGHILFGWAKPVPVNPSKWSSHVLANIAVSGAGPLSNLILALISVLLLKILMITGYWHGNLFQGNASNDPLVHFLMILLVLNISLAVFNLIPIPPLDGSHILSSLLSIASPKLMEAYESTRPYGMIILLACSFTGILWIIYQPLYFAISNGLTRILYAGF